ncbi:MAG: 3-oxoacyl-ACP synthase [Bacteroidota bacterium]
MSLVIHKYCSVKPSRACVNGREIFSNEAPQGLRGYLRALYKHLKVDYPKFFKMDGLSKLGFISVEFLLQDESLLSRHAAEKIGIILSNASSSLEIDEKHQDTINDRNQYFPSPSNFVYTLPNIMAGEAAIRHKFKGENTVLISEKFDAELIHNIASQAFSINALDCCICGWVEQYGDKYEALLFLVENSEGPKSGEGIIFDPINLMKIYKQEWKN